MKTVNLPYGTGSILLPLDIPGIAPEILLPREPAALSDPKAAFAKALANPAGCPPLAEVAKTALAVARARGRLPQVTVAIADHTRPVPDRLLLPWLAEAIGVPDQCITVLVGTGTHRGSAPEELERMLGEATSRFRVINHNCEATSDLILLGKSECGGECWLNRHWVEADLRLATGFIEPHFYAGFSGGSKAVVPGIAGLETIRHFHRATLIAQPGATWANTAGNPLLRLTREMTALCPPHFILNVTLNREKAMTGIYAGHVQAAHEAGCADALQATTVPVAHRFPVVVTTNGGYPLDQNFYQTVKGISSATRILEPGGVILVASRCDQGLPAEGEFAQILGSPHSNEVLHAEIQCTRQTRQDQWQVQTLLQALEKASVLLFSELGTDDRKLTRTGHSESLEKTLREIAAGAVKAGKTLPVAVLPEGPLCVPTLASAHT